MRIKPFHRIVGILLGVVTVTTMAQPPAAAAVPSNDEVTAARVVNSIPSHFTVDTSEATSNPATDTAGAPCIGGNSVWYRFRPAAAVTARVTTQGSEFDTFLGVFRGTPTNLTPVACNDDTAVGSAVQVQFRANTTYFIAVSSCCSPEAGFGGTAVLNLYLPRTLTMSVPLASARAGDVSARALFGGTARCSNPAFLSLGVIVSQRVGALVARGNASLFAECGRTRRPWALAVDSDTGVAFRPGRASVTVRRDVFDGFAETTTLVTQIVTLVNAPNARPIRSTVEAVRPVVK